MATILAADIGGTNCRLGLFWHENELLSLDRCARVGTSAIAHTEALMGAFERELGVSWDAADSVVVAIAGPVADSMRGSLTNGVLKLDFAPLNATGKRCFLINDFMAQAYAVLSPQGEKARHIAGPPRGGRDTVRAVIGAGTGLGQAMLIRLNPRDSSERWLAVPSENGHAAFPFANGAENDFHTFLRYQLNLPYATGDVIVTGRGLTMLHQFLTGTRLDPAKVGEQALNADTPTLRWYARFYARACRNYMLSTLCNGGLWIAGGIAAQNPLIVTCPYFMEELYNAPGSDTGWGNFLRDIPVYLLEDTNSGLWGAARFGQYRQE